MKHTLADPTKDWEGFRPMAYRLDPKKVWHLALTRVEDTSVGQRQTVAVKLGEVLDSLTGRKILEVGSIPPTKVTTDVGELIFAGPSFSRSLLEALLDLRKDGINGFDVNWFWYDRDSVTDDPHDSYSFFAVHKGNIVRERMAFNDYRDSGFDPSIFKAGDDTSPIWFCENEWEAAHARFWYRKFYQETLTGQLMVLREDAPELYHYPEGRWRADMAFGLLYDRIARIQSALWIIVVLMALIAGILLWRL